MFNNKDNYDLDYIDIVTYVNIGLNYNYYTNYNNIDKSIDSIYTLVNKYNKLDNNYVPNDLEEVSRMYSTENQFLKKEVKNAFEKMAESARRNNIYIYAASSYRSYYYQENLYNTYILKDGFIKANSYSAKAGFSEHQTGCATDIVNKEYKLLSNSDIEYKWLIDNSYLYGFILRYPGNKEIITGYMYEPWHFRYVGINIAKYIHDNDITYDEYVIRSN